MRKWFWFLYLVVSLTPVFAQEALPPEGAQVIPGAEGVLLTWPTTTPGRYLVQVYCEQKTVLEQEVQGGKLSVSLRGGLAYQWQVNLLQPTGFLPVVSNREFQVVAQNELVDAGADGASGGPGPGNSFEFDGKPGQNGADLNVTLSRDGAYVRAFVSGGVIANRLLYFAPDAQPFLLAVPGGRGGNGAAGAPDYAYSNGVEEYDGSPGGNGGQGGAGGTITVVSNGLSVGDYLLFNTRGGPGGSAGPGGGPGESPGTPGAPGRDGRVIVH